MTIHEDEVRRLKEEKRVKAPLLASIKKYFEICEEQKELAAAASDQSRLLGRGARDPGRLLREEKMRKRVSKEKPRVRCTYMQMSGIHFNASVQLERDLLSSIPLWEQEAGRPFLVHGECIMQILTESVSAQDQENVNRKGKLGSRAGSVPPRRATTPVSAGVTQGNMPGTKTGVVTPAIRPATSMGSRSVPNKRQRVGDTHSGSYINSGASHSQRAPLGAYRGGNVGRSASSPTKIPTKTSSVKHVPKAGSHHVLGHGRLPGGDPMRSVSSSALNHGRYASGSSIAAANSTARTSLRARRESFKPRPSIDKEPARARAGRWTGGYRSTTSVREEYEED